MKILFIDTAHQILFSILENAGHECVTGYELTRKEILEIIPQYHGAILRSRIQADKEFIDKASQLKFIGRVGAGMESIDVKYAESKGIACINSPEGNCDAVGEHAIAMLLSLFNNINRADTEAKAGKWIREKNRGVELAGKTVGLIGYGNMGKAFAKKLSGFDCRVIAFDKYLKNFSDSFAKEVSMDEIYNNADILSLHVPLTAETKFMVDDGFINRFQKPFYLLNTARGKCVLTNDLVRNIKSGKILGACLDTIEFEEPSFESAPDLASNLSGLNEVSEKVILSPHIAGWTHESKEKLARILGEKIILKFGRSEIRH
jgi:D-3-phosphoglycerate dehydrogenase